MREARGSVKIVSANTLINTLDSLIINLLPQGKNLKFAFTTDKSFTAYDNNIGDPVFMMRLDSGTPISELLKKLHDNGIQVNLARNESDFSVTLVANKKSVEAYHFYESAISADEQNNFVEAERLYIMAAKLGNTKSKTNLAILYLFGAEGVKQDKGRAYELLLESARAGHVRGQFNLARMCEIGDGVEVNLSSAMKWYKAAYEGGLTDAKADFERVQKKYQEQNALWLEQKKINASNEAKRLYEKGISEERNPNGGNAATYYRQAVNYGHIESKEKLAFHVLKGTGGAKKDENKAFALYAEAANAGNARAQFNLATLFEDGRGVEVDLKKAKHWYEQALKNGIKLASQDIARIDDKLLATSATETRHARATSSLESPQGKAQPYTLERTMGFFNPGGYNAAKKVLESEGWKLPDLHGRKEGAPIVVTKDKDQFVISPGKFTTSSANQGTFEAMLKAFKASNPDVIPVITTNNETNKAIWISAYNQVYQGKGKPNIIIENPTPSKDLGKPDANVGHNNEQPSAERNGRRPN